MHLNTDECFGSRSLSSSGPLTVFEDAAQDITVLIVGLALVVRQILHGYSLKLSHCRVLYCSIMSSNETVNPTNFGIEQGYPERLRLPDEYVSWEVSLPDSVHYGRPISNLSPSFGTVVEKMRRKGVDISAADEITELSRMSRNDVEIAKGVDYAARLSELRYPLGRTGINGLGIFYEAGASITADLIVLHEHEGGIEVPLVFSRNRWNTPGGFANPDESITDTALREFLEETGHDLEKDSPTLLPIVHEVKPSDRSTDHGWLEANALTARVYTRFAVSIGPNADDAEDVRWWDVEALPSLVARGQLSQQKMWYVAKAIGRIASS